MGEMGTQRQDDRSSLGVREFILSCPVCKCVDLPHQGIIAAFVHFIPLAGHVRLKPGSLSKRVIDPRQPAVSCRLEPSHNLPINLKVSSCLGVPLSGGFRSFCA
jgi:hypothetical protein